MRLRPMGFFGIMMQVPRAPMPWECRLRGLMIIDEVKATLAMEGIALSEDEEKLVSDYVEGKISMAELRKTVADLLKKQKAA